MGIFPAAPLVMIKDNKPAGLFIDLIDYFSKSLDWHIQYEKGNWNELLLKLEKGEIDLLPAVGYTEKRIKIYDFNRHAVFIDSGVLFTSSKFTLHTVFELQDKRIAALKGSIFTDGFINYITLFGVKCEIIYTNDNIAVMQAITRGEADAGVCIYSLGNELARNFPVKITPINFTPIALHFAVPKDKNGELISEINNKMDIMIDKPDSIYNQSFNKWIFSPNNRKLPDWFWWGVIGFVIIGIFLIYWNFLLKYQVSLKTKNLEDEIIERKHAQAELELHRLHLSEMVDIRTSELALANKELEAFSYSISHDLKAPLRAISGFSEILIKEKLQNTDKETQGYLEKIKKASEKMSILIDELLNLSKISKMDVLKVSFNISEVSKEIISNLRSTSPERIIDFIFPESMIVYADINLIKIALENLIGNAWKYTSKKSNAVIELGMKIINNKKVFFVKDNGDGFDMKYADKLFIPFQRLHNFNEFEGSGIGLALVKRIITKHNGEIWAESIKGEGTELYFTLPD